MKAILIALSLLTLFVAIGARADEYHDRVLVLGSGLAAGPPVGFPIDGVVPDVGGWITLEGTISEVHGFFEDLLPAGPYELTYVFAGATCDQFSSPGAAAPCPLTAYGRFHGGTLSIFLDTTPDADFAHGETFGDGELVLIAAQVEHRIWNVDAGPGCVDVPDWSSLFVFYGGSWYPRIANPPFVAQLDGEIDANVPAGLAALGFTFNVPSGDIDLKYNVATRPTSWGYVKSLYR